MYIYWILLLALLLRVQDNGFNFWSDELYTATVAGSPYLPFMSVFTDPGNPPLYFLFAKIWMMVFGEGESVCRLLSTLFSLVSIYLAYKFLNDNPADGAEKALKPRTTALLAAFLLAINIYSIHSAREFRAYQLGAMLSIAAAVYLFKLIKRDKPCDYAIYGLIAMMMANTHYFQILIIAGNFFFGIFAVKSKRKFFIANCMAALAFLPYFMITALNRALLDTEFNNGINRPHLTEMYTLFGQFFDTKIIASIVLLTALILLYKKSYKANITYLYSLYTVLFLYASSYIFSLMRPIIKSFYYINIIPFCAIILALLFSYVWRLRGKWLLSIVLAALYFSGGNFFSKAGLLLINFDSIFNYAAADSVKYRVMGKKIGIAIHDTPNYALHYKKLLKGDEVIIMHDFSPNWHNEILNAPADVIYMRVTGKQFPRFVAIFSLFADVSIVRGEKDVLAARIVKRKIK